MAEIRYLFFLLVLLIPIGLADAEVGKNYDIIKNPNGSYTWQSHPERILDDNWQWVNYKFTQDLTTISFEAVSVSFVLDKITCDFKFDPEIPVYEIQIYKDDLPTLPTCIIDNITQNEQDVTLELIKNGMPIQINLDMINGAEWFYHIDNKDPKTTKYTIMEVCKNCTPDKIENNILYFGNARLDTKNEQHNTLQKIETKGKDITVEFEKTLAKDEKFTIDPTFGYDAPSYDAWVFTSSASGAGCPTITGGTIDTTGTIDIQKAASTGPGTCGRAIVEWDISAINDNADILTVGVRYDVTLDDNAVNCDWNSIEARPSTLGVTAMWNDIGDGTTFVTNNSGCQTAASDQVLSLGASAPADLEANLVDNWWGVGIKFTSETRDATPRTSRLAEAQTELQVTYTFDQDAVTDLIATDIRGTAVDLSWSTPSGLAPDGYQVNYSTPQSENPTTIFNPDTGTTSTTITVSGLTGETEYSFRVGGRLDSFVNGSGNVLNVTTLFDPTASFTPGTFNLTAVGSDDRPIVFTRNDISETDLFLNITVDTDWNLACNFHYKFANVNKTYTNIANTTIDSETDAVGFRFNDVDNEIIDVLCWDQYTNASGRYLITQNDFPFLQNILDFRDGQFGTQGMFGALDMITLVAVIIGMVGFNRANESVGGIFLLFIMGGLAFFEIISWPSVMTAGIVLALIVVIGSTRKD